jgi:hypothetical protein
MIMNRFTYISITMSIFIIQCASCAAPAEQWNKTFSFIDKSGASWPALGQTVQQTNDEGYIIVATIYAYGYGNKIWLIKTDLQGTRIWDRIFDPNSPGAYGWSVRQTRDGGYIIAGGRDANFNHEDLWLIKTNSTGYLQWSRIFNFMHSASAFSIEQTVDNGYIATGRIDIDWYNSSILLFKIDSNGNGLWNRTFGGVKGNGGHSVQLSNDGGYIITGFTSYYSNNLDTWLIKTDANGNPLWNKTFGGTGEDMGYSVQRTNDGGYIITGVTSSNPVGGGARDVWLIKTDGYGNKTWDHHFGNSNSADGHSVQQTSDGGYIIAGNNVGIWLIKTDIAGNMLWDKKFTSTSAGLHAYGNFVQQTNDGGYIITGYKGASGTPSAVWLIKVGPSKLSVDQIGVLRNGAWFFDLNGNRVWDSGDLWSYFGIAGDQPAVGDWNGDGKDEIGVLRNGAWYFDLNGNRVWDSGDLWSYFGISGDRPAVGDWNGDSKDEIGVLRNGAWYFDLNGNRVWDSGDLWSYFGIAGDQPAVGDWNGDGKDEIGVLRNGAWFFDLNGNRVWDSGDLWSYFGIAGDLPVAGRWS